MHGETDVEMTDASQSAADVKRSANQSTDYVEIYNSGKQEIYNRTALLIGAMINANPEEVEQVIKERGVKGDDYAQLLRSHKKQLTESYKKKFEFIRWWPCSPIWVALELVIKSKQDRELPGVYERRLKILKIVATMKRDEKNDEAVLLRKDCPPSGCWLVGYFFGECFGLGNDVYIHPIHRAAQADNLKAFEILWDPNNIVCDSVGWSPWEYAIKHKSDQVIAYLALNQIGQKKLEYCSSKDCDNCGCTSLCCLLRCYGTKTAKHVVDELT